MRNDRIDPVVIFLIIFGVACIGCLFILFASKVLPEGAYRCSKCDEYTYDREQYHDEFRWDYDIVSVTNHYSYSGTVEGSSTAAGFLLFYESHGTIEGSLEQQETYSFYYVTKDGGYKKMSIPVENATIYYTQEKPHIYCGWQAGNYWICKAGHKNYSWQVTYYKIYVPEGSIAEEYDLG